MNIITCTCILDTNACFSHITIVQKIKTWFFKDLSYITKTKKNVALKNDSIILNTIKQAEHHCDGPFM